MVKRIPFILFIMRVTSFHALKHFCRETSKDRASSTKFVGRLTYWRRIILVFVTWMMPNKG